MRKSPAFSFYPDSWFGGTFLMSHQQKGIYLDLLCLQWLHGCFTFACAKRACQSVSEDEIKFVLDEKFETDGFKFWNARLEEEREKQRKRADAGSKGGSKRQANAKQTVKQNSSKQSSKQSSKTQASDSDSDSVSVLGSESNSDSDFFGRPVRENPPKVEEIAFYLGYIGKDKSEAGVIFDFYTANGWVQGNSNKPVMDWQAAVRAWFNSEIAKRRSTAVAPREVAF